MKCQFHDLFTDVFGELDYSMIQKLWYNIKKVPIAGSIGMFFLKIFRGTKKRALLLIGRINMKSKTRNKSGVGFEHPAILNLKKGDVVKVRSKEEIEQTLDENNKFKGVEFMEGMWQYCEQTHRVFKRVEKILDPWAGRLRKCRNMVILEGLFCHGDPAHAPECDRTCLYYWKEAWLERVSH